MEQNNLNLLKNINRLEVSEVLYDKITQRIALKRSSTIPFYKVGIVVSILFALIVSQILFITKSQNLNVSDNKTTSEILEINNNTLYYE